MENQIWNRRLCLIHILRLGDHAEYFSGWFLWPTDNGDLEIIRIYVSMHEWERVRYLCVRYILYINCINSHIQREKRTNSSNIHAYCYCAAVVSWNGFRSRCFDVNCISIKLVSFFVLEFNFDKYNFPFVICQQVRELCDQLRDEPLFVSISLYHTTLSAMILWKYILERILGSIVLCKNILKSQVRIRQVEI